jgi:TatD DNase family protein
MVLVDSHTHLFAEEFKEDRHAVIQRAMEAGVHYMLLPNIDSESLEALKALSADFPQNCLPMIGLHPCSVKEGTYHAELELVRTELFSDYKYYGVGEIGMDLYWDKSTVEIQKDAFRMQCEWAAELNLGVSIHTRSATYESIKVIKSLEKIPRGVFHCFTGSYEEAKEILNLGMCLGIGGVLTFKNTNLPEVLKKVSLEHLVLETDSPYLSPVPFRGKRNESAYIPYIANKLSEIYNIPVEEVAKASTENAMRVFLIDL